MLCKFQFGQQGADDRRWPKMRECHMSGVGGHAIETDCMYVVTLLYIRNLHYVYSCATAHCSTQQ